MNILIIGGYPAIAYPLAEGLTARSHMVQLADLSEQSVLGASTRSEFLSFDTSQALFDVVHFCAPSSLSRAVQDRCLAKLCEFEKASARIVIQEFQYSKETTAFYDALPPQSTVLSSSVELLKKCSALNPRWLPVGITVSDRLATVDYPAKGERVKIVYEKNDAETVAAMDRALARVQEMGFVISPLAIDATQLESLEHLRLVLEDADLFVDTLSVSNYSYGAIEALAQGTTVLGRSGPALSEVWNNAALCSVLDTNLETLEDRLLSIVQEPKSLRDLGNRSYTYARANHNIDRLLPEYLEIYR